METCNIEGCIVYFQKIMLMTPHLVSHSISDPNPKSYELSKPEIKFHVMEEKYAALRTYDEFTTFLGKNE